MEIFSRVTQYKDQIKQLVALGNLEEAVKLLIDFTTEFCPTVANEAILISSRFSFLGQNVRKGLITEEEAEKQKNQITSHLLVFLDESVNQIAKENKNTDGAEIIGDLEHLSSLIDEIRNREVPDDIVLEAKNIKKSYRRSSFNLNLNKLVLHTGEIIGLIGENATGKTTLLRILAGDLKHDSGELKYPFFQKDKRLDWQKIKRQIAYIPQELPRWYGSLIDNITLEAADHGFTGKENTKALNYIIQRLGLAAHTEKSWAELSGGYKLRFALAKALVWKPRLLILDEPLANLDIRTQVVLLNDLQNLVKSIRYPLTVILSSQQIHEIEEVANQLLYMREGNLECLVNVKEYGNNRNNNVFELNCSLSYREMVICLEEFPHKKLWYNGMTFFIVTPLKIPGSALLQYLAEKKAKVNYYRDISRSLKPKFYEDFL